MRLGVCHNWPTMSLPSFSSLSSYSSESGISLSTIFRFWPLHSPHLSPSLKKEKDSRALSASAQGCAHEKEGKRHAHTHTRLFEIDRAAMVPYSHGLRSPGSQSAPLIVIFIDGEPLPLAAPTAVLRPSHSRPSQLHPFFPPASMPLLGVPPHPLPGPLRDFTAPTSRNSP